jgi:hypothetical protein
MKLPDLNKLCSPAQLYLFIELVLVIIMLVQNGTSDDTLCLGSYECYDAPNKAILLLVKLGYVGFWTFVLNLICNAGYKSLSWFLVLLPAILFLLLLVLLLGPWNYNGYDENNLIIEGNTNMNTNSNCPNIDVKNVTCSTIEQIVNSYSKNNNCRSKALNSIKDTIKGGTPERAVWFIQCRTGLYIKKLKTNILNNLNSNLSYNKKINLISRSVDNFSTSFNNLCNNIVKLSNQPAI